MSGSHTHLRAIGYALAGFTCWVFGDMFMKLAGEFAIPKYQIMATGGIGGMISISTITMLRGKLHHLRPRKFKPLLALGLLFLMNYIVWLLALARLPIANFYTVIFLSPTVASIFAAIFMREHLTIPKIMAIAAGFVGVVIAVNPTHSFDGNSDWVGYGMAFAGMLVASTQMLVLRHLGSRETREATAFYPRIAAILGGVLAILINGFMPMPWHAVIYSLLTGAIGGIGWMFMAQAYTLAPAAIVAPFMYSEIISGGLVGYFIWHDVPSPNLLTGATIIIASGLYIVTHAHRTEKRARVFTETP